MACAKSRKGSKNFLGSVKAWTEFLRIVLRYLMLKFCLILEFAYLKISNQFFKTIQKSFKKIGAPIGSPFLKTY